MFKMLSPNNLQSTKPCVGQSSQTFTLYLISTIHRDTIDFILHNDVAKDLIEWLKTTRIPDETFFATLNFNSKLNIPGTYNGKKGLSLLRCLAHTIKLSESED